jgi:hypothetical protein
MRSQAELGNEETRNEDERDERSEPGPLPEVALGERAFEILMARQMAAGELTTTWFDRHGATLVTEVPAHWPAPYRRLVEQRIDRIASDRNIGLLERPEYKRRWNREPWAAREQRALRERLLARLEHADYWPEPALQTTRRLAERAAADPAFLRLAEVYRGRPDFDVPALVDELATAEAVPNLPVLRYKPAGLRKRAVWERTWDLQREEDAIDTAVAAELPRHDDESEDDHRARVEAAQKRRKQQQIGDIPPPPKYRSADFLRPDYWRLRGALDVPKERFIAYPYLSRAADPSLLLGWAGWDHLQQAFALADHYQRLKDEEGFTPEQLKPALAGFLQLIPWLKQWHNAIDPAYNLGMGDYFESFVLEEARELRLTPDQIRAWAPPATATRRRRSSAR